MMLILYFLLTVAASTTIALIESRLFPHFEKRTIYLVAFLLPSATMFLVGIAIMIYFLNMPPDLSHGGDGPAFFGLLAIMILCPLALLVPGALSTMIVTAILSRTCKPHRRPDPIYDGDS